MRTKRMEETLEALSTQAFCYGVPKDSDMVTIYRGEHRAVFDTESDRWKIIGRSDQGSGLQPLLQILEHLAPPARI